MLLKNILKTHEQYSTKNSLKENLGDGFLLQENLIYKRTRTLAFKAGVTFTHQRFFDYDALALTQLPKILEKKTVPYCNNVNPLREIEEKAPGVFIWSEIPPLRANYLLHESAHVIARQLRLKYIKKTPKETLRLSAQKKNQELTLCTLLEEAFANATESLANVYATTDLHDEFLFKNSYIMEKAPERKHLSWMVKRIGDEAAFRLSFFSFLYSNFVKTNSAMDDFDRVLDLVFLHDLPARRNLKTPDLKQLKQAFRVGLELDPAFTIFTNAFCLRLMGIKTEFFDLLNFDFLSYFEKDERYQKLLVKMALQS